MLFIWHTISTVTHMANESNVPFNRHPLCNWPHRNLLKLNKTNLLSAHTPHRIIHRICCGGRTNNVNRAASELETVCFLFGLLCIFYWLQSTYQKNQYIESTIVVLRAHIHKFEYVPTPTYIVFPFLFTLKAALRLHIKSISI